MSENDAISTAILETPPRVSEWRRFSRVFLNRGVVIFGLIIVVTSILTAAFAQNL